MHPVRGASDARRSTLLDGRGSTPVVIILARLKLGEDVDEFANAARCQRPPGIEHRLVIGEPGLCLREFVHRRAGSNDLGDGNVVGCANEDLRVGLPVEVVFDRINDEVTLPRFRPRG